MLPLTLFCSKVEAISCAYQIYAAPRLNINGILSGRFHPISKESFGFMQLTQKTAAWSGFKRKMIRDLRFTTTYLAGNESEPMMTAFESCVSRYAISAYSVLSKTGFVQALQPHRHDLCRSTLGC